MHEMKQKGVFFPLKANMLFVSINVLAGKGFCETFLPLSIYLAVINVVK